MNTNVVAELNEIRHEELLREAENWRLAKAAQRGEARTAFRLPARWRRTGWSVVWARPA